jgi:DNA-binding Lrp family transcriptional regulator
VQGVIFDELEKYVVRELGQTGLSRIRDLTGRGTGGYQFDKAYPDDEMFVILRGLVEATKRAPEEMVEEFGEVLASGLLEVYGFLVDPRWSFLEFLLNTDMVIHAGVKLNTPGAKPPLIQALRAGPETVKISYRSRRRLCPLAKGIVRGVAAYYKVAIVLTEELCMLRGDSECVITVAAQE